jgi:DNA-binding transcriptional regulator WhiA
MPGGSGAISFAGEVKSELSGLAPARRCCQVAELLAIYSASRGRLIRNGDLRSASFPLLRNAVARKVLRLARLLGGIEAKYQAVRSPKLMSFFVELSVPPGMVEEFTRPATATYPPLPCDRKAMLRGLFLGCGSVNAPTARHHLELVLPTAGWASTMVRLLQGWGVGAGVMERAGHQVVYVKDGDGIVRTLTLMGASRAVMEFENARVLREVSSQINRQLNCETANIDKTVGSALRQVAAIERLERSGRLAALSPALREIARARRSNPDLNLSELASHLHLSKSAVNHRLRRLLEVAEEPQRNGPPPVPVRTP